MIRAVLLAVAVLTGTAAMAEAPLRPMARPAPQAVLRPMLRPDQAGVTPVVAKALAPVARHAARAEALMAGPVRLPVVTPQIALPHSPVARQEARLDALSVVRAPPAIVVLVNLWETDLPLFRPEGDFGGDIAGIDVLTAAILRPALRPDRGAAPVLLASAAASLRPMLRPGDPVPEVISDATPTYGAAMADPAAPALSALAVAVALRPEERNPVIVARAEAARVTRVRGSVCGNPQIQGEVLGDVSGSGACGIADAVLVRSVDGVRLSTAGTMDCGTANALQTWIHDVARPVLADTGGGLVGLQIAGTYACRPRNNQSGARLSEHGHGRAVDIAGFNLAGGGTITVLNGWGSGSQGDRLRQMHRAACGIFGTVLGPEANRFHRDHFHFDTARYRSGSYCE